jgi:hypothetical protein
MTWSSSAPGQPASPQPTSCEISILTSPFWKPGMISGAAPAACWSAGFRRTLVPCSSTATPCRRSWLLSSASARPGSRPHTHGIHVNNVTVVDNDNDRLIDQLPISARAREQLRAFVRTSLEEYARYTQAGRLTDDAGGLAGHTIADRLIGLEADTVDIISSAIRGGSVADPSELSAQYALRYFASYLAHEQHNRRYPIDGMQGIPRAMADRLPAGTVRLGTRVTWVAFDSSSESYMLTVDGETEPIRAREVVLAVPAPVASQIAADLPAWKTEALAVASMPGSTTLCITADATGLPEIGRWAFVAVTGRTFDAVINPHPVSPGVDEEPTTVQFVCYSASAGHRPDLISDPAATDAWVEEFLAVALSSEAASWAHTCRPGSTVSRS